MNQKPFRSCGLLLHTVVFALCICNLGPCSFHAAAQSANSSKSGQDGLSPILTNNPIYQRDLWLWKQRAFPLSDIPKGARNRALDQITRSQGKGATQSPSKGGTTTTKTGDTIKTGTGTSGPPTGGANQWVSIGPSP